MGPPRPYAPFERDVPLRGRSLRHASLALLQRAGWPLSVAELRHQLEAAGFSIAGPDPNKALADALRWEVARKRLRRVARGRYAVGRLPKVTASRVRHRWQASVSAPNGTVGW